VKKRKKDKRYKKGPEKTPKVFQKMGKNSKTQRAHEKLKKVYQMKNFIYDIV
jgi:hypothetical protein